MALLYRLPTIFVLGMFILCPPSRAASADEAAPDAHRAALRSLPSACATDYARLCPQAAEGSHDALSMLVCLKDHMVDTSLSCRSVVRAARH